MQSIKLFMASSVLEVRYLGTHQPYEASLRLMGALHQQRACDEIPDQLLLLEHNPVITITRQHKTRSLISSIDSIKDDGIEFFEADRGGDATFHGPGQIVGYPIMKLSSNCYDSLAHIEYYMRSLEYALLKSLEELGLKNAMTIPGFAGIWLRQKKLKKLVAIGVGLSQGVTKHGFALNTSIDAKKFTKHIIPCGLKDRDVATLKEAFLEQQLSWPDVSVVLTKLASNIARQFSKTLFWHS